MSYVKELGKGLVNGFVLGVGVLLAVSVMSHLFHIVLCGQCPIVPLVP